MSRRIRALAQARLHELRAAATPPAPDLSDERSTGVCCPTSPAGCGCRAFLATAAASRLRLRGERWKQPDSDDQSCQPDACRRLGWWQLVRSQRGAEPLDNSPQEQHGISAGSMFAQAAAEATARAAETARCDGTPTRSAPHAQGMVERRPEADLKPCGFRPQASLGGMLQHLEARTSVGSTTPLNALSRCDEGAPSTCTASGTCRTVIRL